jgi:hypothetical protein
VGSREKAKWIFGTILELADNENFSLAVTPVNHQSAAAVVPVDHNECALDCYEICRTGAEYKVFVFSSPPKTGEVKAFLVHDNVAGQAAQESFEASWNQAMKIKEGSEINLTNLHRLAIQFSLQGEAIYLKLAAKKGIALQVDVAIHTGNQSTNIEQQDAAT